MDLLFANGDLQRLCNEQRAMIECWGPADAAAVGQRLHELDAVDVLGDLRSLPHIRMVQEEGGAIVVEGRDGVRLLVAPHEGNPKRRGAGPWHEAAAVVVLDVVIESP